MFEEDLLMQQYQQCIVEPHCRIATREEPLSTMYVTLIEWLLSSTASEQGTKPPTVKTMLGCMLRSP